MSIQALLVGDSTYLAVLGTCQRVILKTMYIQIVGPTNPLLERQPREQSHGSISQQKNAPDSIVICSRRELEITSFPSGKNE